VIVAFGAHEELVLLALLVAAGGLLAAAQPLRIPYPILLVLGGLTLGFIPGVPRLQLPPDVVLAGFVPLLLYSSTFFTSLRDLRANLRPIGLLAIGLVIATTLGVAAVAHAAIDGMGWRESFVLGAVVSPTDAIAATAIARRLGMPRRFVTIVEGESLVNDGTALVVYRVAIAAVVTGSFSMGDAALRFLLNAVGGVAIGVAVGFVVAGLRRRLNNPPVETTISLLTGYFAYLPAQAAGLSGVLAVVTAGIYMGRRTPELTNAEQRLQGAAAWEIITFVLNSLLFGLVGLQLHGILDRLSGVSAAHLALWGALAAGSVAAIRLIWIYPATYLPRWAFPSIRARDPYPALTWPTAIGWAGMRGGVSLAAALAVPLTVHSGAPFPHRDLIIFLTFCVILGTLVVQGLTLPVLIRVLGFEDDGLDAREEAKARIKSVEAALVRLEELVAEGGVLDDTAERVRGLYNFRSRRFRARFDDGDDGSIEERSQAYQRLMRQLYEAERAEVVRLRGEGLINDEVMNRVVRDLDLQDSRLDA
jgi:CPA1 family monovalent cation:H+ antiporter